MRIFVTLATLALVAVALPGTVHADDTESTFTETVVYEGTVGCAVGAGPLAPRDACGSTTHSYGPSFDGLTTMDVTFAYDALPGQTLQLKLFGPPGGSLTGPSPQSAHYDGSGGANLPNSTFTSKFDVRADLGVAYSSDYTVTIVYTYAGEGSSTLVFASTSGNTETFVFQGTVGCSVGAGPVKRADACGGADTVPITPSQNVTDIHTELVWDSVTAPELQVSFIGPPSGVVSGTSPLVADFNAADHFPGQNGPWDGAARVRASTGAAVGLDFTFTVTFTYEA